MWLKSNSAHLHCHSKIACPTSQRFPRLRRQLPGKVRYFYGKCTDQYGLFHLRFWLGKERSHLPSRPTTRTLSLHPSRAISSQNSRSTSPCLSSSSQISSFLTPATTSSPWARTRRISAMPIGEVAAVINQTRAWRE